MKSEKKLFGLAVYMSNMDSIVRECLVPLSPDDAMRLLVTPNVDHLRNLRNSSVFRDAYSGAWRMTIDGFPLYFYCRCLGLNAEQRITGSDLFPRLLYELSHRKDKMFFVASSQVTVDGIKAKLAHLGVSEDRLEFEVPKFGFERDSEYSKNLALRIKRCGTNHLFFGVGSPKSEVWLHNHKDILSGVYSYCFGAGLDFYAGTTRRAPLIMQRSGFEWLWRLMADPSRLFRRYFIGLWVFLLLVVKDLTVGVNLLAETQRSTEN